MLSKPEDSVSEETEDKQMLLKQRTQKPVINAMMAADYAESNLTNPKDEFSARRFANLSERKRELS